MKATAARKLSRRRLDHGLSDGVEETCIQLLAEKERALRLSAIHAERDELFQMWLHNKLDDTLYQGLLRELDLIEGALTWTMQQLNAKSRLCVT